MPETLSSFWRKLKIGTKVKITFEDHYRQNSGTSHGTIVLVQTNAVGRDGTNHDKSKVFTKDDPCYFRKPKSSECEISENKLVEHNERCSTTVTYEILEAKI